MDVLQVLKEFGPTAGTVATVALFIHYLKFYRSSAERLQTEGVSTIHKIEENCHKRMDEIVARYSEDAAKTASALEGNTIALAEVGLLLRDSELVKAIKQKRVDVREVRKDS